MRLGIGAITIGALSVLALGGPPPAPRPSPGTGPSARTPPAPLDSDLLGIRDIFRFGDEEKAPSPGAARDADEPPAMGESAAVPASGPRLVGLVRRGGALVAAIALEGEIVLLGCGDSASGYTVVDVSEERVIIRDAAGVESVLPLGPS